MARSLFEWTGSGIKQQNVPKEVRSAVGREPGPINNRNVPTRLRFCCVCELTAEKTAEHTKRDTFCCLGDSLGRRTAETYRHGYVSTVWMDYQPTDSKNVPTMVHFYFLGSVWQPPTSKTSHPTAETSRIGLVPGEVAHFCCLARGCDADIARMSHVGLIRAI